MIKNIKQQKRKKIINYIKEHDKKKNRGNYAGDIHFTRKI